VTDKLKMHQSESLVRFVAKHDGSTADVGEKAKGGLLPSMATRAAFFADPTPRMGFHSTPQHASWRHQLEMGCSRLGRTLLTRASFTAVADLQAQVVAFIAYFHATMAKPFQWTYGRQPLSVYRV
jgi:hypothetical protein